MHGIIYITRHGESQFNQTGQIGGNSNLTDKGKEYAINLHNLLGEKDLKIYTSQLERTIETSKYFDINNIERLSFLNEINSGIFDGYTYNQILNKYPEEHSARKLDKYNYRYPEGESYADLKKRVMAIFDCIKDEKKDILIICHNAVLRIIYSVLFNIPDSEIPHINIPLHTLFKVTSENNIKSLVKINLK